MSKYVVIGFCFLLLSCDEPDRAILVQDLIEERIQERLDQYTKVFWIDCERELMTDATGMVDSLLRENPILIRLDSLERPPKPEKPGKPEFVKPEDPEPLEPILPNKKRKESNQ